MGVVILGAVRTPIGAIGGGLASVQARELATLAIRKAIEAAGIAPEQVQYTCMGWVMQDLRATNLAKVAAEFAGVPDTSPGTTFHENCASGGAAIHSIARRILLGEIEVGVAGGVESMSTVPMGGYNLLPHPVLMETSPEVYTPMGVTAENVVAKYGLTREEMDQFAYNSHMKAAAAQKAGKFDGEIIPVPYKNWATGEMASFDKDECVRPETTIEGLAKLKGVFKQGGSVTAGNSSPTNDGAAAVMVVSEDVLKRHNLKPILRLVNFQVAGVPPEIMGVGPAAAVPKLMKKVGMKYDDVAVWELNEAFAAQSVAVVKSLPELNTANLNVNGGAIALGHPLGCTGAKLTVQIMNEMQRRKARYGVVGMCIGGGMGAAGLFELV